MAQILTPGFLRWDGTKYILDPDVEGSIGPTIVNSGVGVLPDVVSDENGIPASVIAFTGSSSMSVTGIKDGVESRELKIFNTNNGATLTVKHLDNTSSINNQIICPGGVDYVLQYQEGVLLIYSNVESKWRVVDKNFVAPPATALPGGINTQIQFNNAGALGGVTNWLSSGANRIHIDYHIMKDGPSLTFNGNTITRSFGSWANDGDGFKIGDIISIRGAWYDNSNVPQTPLNIINTVITGVAGPVLTITAVITPAGYSLGSDVFAQGGGFLSGGNNASNLPDSGMFRIPEPDSYIDTEIMTVRDSNGDTIPIISVSNGIELMIGGTFNEANLAAGVTNRRPETLAFWGGFQIDHTDERVWRDDKSGFVNFLNEFRAWTNTTNATPTTLKNQNFSSIQPFPFVELYVVASKVFPADEGATWKFTGSGASTTFDWRTASYHANTAGASTWACTVTGDAHITVTGQAGVNIFWRVYGRFI